MTRRTGIHGSIWGVLSILAGGLMTQGGMMAVMTYGEFSSRSSLIVGVLGALASLTLLVSGVAFLTRRSFGRKVAIAGAVAMIPVHLAGWMLQVVGIPGMIAGVAYPMVLLLVLGIRPGLGAPVPAQGGSASKRVPPSSDLTRRRAVVEPG
jgi:hypothetical protein